MKKCGVGIALLVFLCLCLAAASAEAPEVYFTCAAREAQTAYGQAVERVELMEYGRRVCLPAPAGWPLDALCVHYGWDGPLLAEANGETVTLHSGEPTDVFARAETVTLCDAEGRRLCDVRVMQGSLPAVFIQTETDSMQVLHDGSEAREPGAMTLLSGDGEAVYQGALREMRVRGNTTAGYAKRPYQIKLEDKAELIPGAGRARTWNLLADYLDLTLLRNRIVLELAREVGMRFAIRAQSVDLYTNGYYRGVYLLTEKVQVGSSRVDITDTEDELEELNPEAEYPFHRVRDGSVFFYGGFEMPVEPDDLTGGYLLEIDKALRVRKQTDHGFAFCEISRLGVQIDTPAPATMAQAAYVYELVNAFERAIYARDGVDPETGRAFADIIDVDSFALKFLLEDVSANYDAKAGSQYFYKDRDAVDPKLYAGPGWDYDLTFANCRATSAVTSYMQTKNLRGSWWDTLFDRHAAFRERVDALYRERYVPAIEILLGIREPGADSCLRSIDAYAAEIAASAEMNFLRYSYGSIEGYNREVGRSHDTCLAFLKRFLARRVEALGAYYAEAAE